MSKKRAKYLRIYNIIRLNILEAANYRCFVDGCTKPADSIEHQRGRQHDVFFDDSARDNDKPLLIDERWLKPCCGDHNREFENNSELSKTYQLSKIHGGTKKQ